jgi:hypothetical protein
MTEVEPDPPQNPPAASLAEQDRTNDPPRCTNCGATVSGSYCSACGQAVEYQLHSFWELLREATEVVTHADSRLWRTLRALLFQPGFLTQQFLAGRRARFLPPFRLYFVLSVLFFIMVSITHIQPTPAPGAVTSAAATPATVDAGARGAAAQQLCESAVSHSPLAGADKVRQLLVAACLKSQADQGRELREIFIRNLGRAMFVLLPLIAAFMKLLYWRPARSYVTHLMLLLHFHAFAFLLLSSLLAAQRWIHASAVRELVLFAAIGWVTFYLYRSMGRVYEETSWRTALKCAALSLAYVACALFMGLIAGLYSAETL